MANPSAQFHNASKPSTFFWLSLSIHLLFLLIILYYYYFPTQKPTPDKKEETYYYYVPASITPASTPMAAEATKTAQKRAATASSVASQYDLSLTKANPAYKELMQDPKMSELLNQTTRTQTSSEYRYLEPIHLVGEKLLDDPFRKLLGRAITGKLYYPEMARNLQLRGRVSIGFILHPDGAITDARILKSSREHILDTAALEAVTRASPIANVDLYLKEAEYLVVNIIF